MISTRANDASEIERLLDQAFGADRRQKTAYRLRENNQPVQDLSFIAEAQNRLVGTIEFWPIAIGDKQTPALLLGPLAVAHEFAGFSCGLALMKCGLEAARKLGHGLVLLVGDEPYYAKAGFRQIPAGRVRMPGPFEPQRLLFQELIPGAFDGVEGGISV